MSANKSGIAVALLVGVAVGVGIGILMAPEKGSKTREKIKGGLDSAKKGLKDKYNAAKEAAAQTDAEGSYDELLSTLSEKSEDVIAFLESKLASLKKEVSKF